MTYFRRRLSACLAAFMLSAAPSSLTAGADDTAPDLRLWRLDCGAIQVNDLNDFSDTYAYTGRSMRLTASCYLIRHGDQYMLWDTGLSAEMLGNKLEGPDAQEATLTRTIVDQLKDLGLSPEQVSDIGISHYHFDHTGQAKDFPSARLHIGKGDADALQGADNSSAKALAPWFGGDSRLDPVQGDRDIYGDGTVMMLDLKGHTPGHHGLLVKLPNTGYVLLSGDVAHFRENYDTDGLPAWNHNRADSLAALERVHAIAANLKATFIIQHDPRDIAKLPAFPASAD